MTYKELRDMAIGFADEGKKELAIGAIFDALTVAGYDPYMMAYAEVRIIANAPHMLPDDPKKIPEQLSIYKNN